MPEGLLWRGPRRPERNLAHVKGPEFRDERLCGTKGTSVGWQPPNVLRFSCRKRLKSSTYRLGMLAGGVEALPLEAYQHSSPRRDRDLSGHSSNLREAALTMSAPVLASLALPRDKKRWALLANISNFHSPWATSFTARGASISKPVDEKIPDQYLASDADLETGARRNSINAFEVENVKTVQQRVPVPAQPELCRAVA
ncbi:hypothetical protein MRB53_038091 [Persea americana]|nr:hypothetical protein MRB53_038091 [Persea americana]